MSMLNCRDATRLMSEAQERPLSFMERVSLKFHLSMCKGCHNFSQQMNALRKMARGFSKGKHDPSGMCGEQ